MLRLSALALTCAAVSGRALQYMDGRAQAIPSIPPPPGPCNVSSDDPIIFQADAHFAYNNKDCWDKFRTCMQGEGPCYNDCNSGASQLNDACYTDDANFCSVYGRNDDPDSGILFDVKSNDCLPAACDSPYNGQMLDIWKVRLCGDLWNSSQCAISLDCDYENDVTSRVWLIVGSVCGAAGFVLVLCATAYCYMKRKELLEEDELFEELESGEEGSGSSSGDHDVMDVAAAAAGYAFANPHGGGGDVPSDSGDTRALLDAAEDPVPYTYAQLPRPAPAAAQQQDRDPAQGTQRGSQ